MEMGDKKIGLPEVDTEYVKAALHCIPALLPPQAATHHQMVSPPLMTYELTALRGLSEGESPACKVWAQSLPPIYWSCTLLHANVTTFSPRRNLLIHIPRTIDPVWFPDFFFEDFSYIASWQPLPEVY